jgi:hypothetical protein
MLSSDAKQLIDQIDHLERLTDKLMLSIEHSKDVEQRTIAVARKCLHSGFVLARAAVEDAPEWHWPARERKDA